MDRAVPGAKRTPMRNLEYGHGLGVSEQGWIIDGSTPTRIATEDSNLDETAFDAFSATFSGTSLDVTIAAGEAHFDGYLATDESHMVTLDADTVNQTVYVGWDASTTYDEQEHTERDEADTVIIGLDTAFSGEDPRFPLYTFDTDTDGVIADEDHRFIHDAPDDTRGVFLGTYESESDLPDVTGPAIAYVIEDNAYFFNDDI